jgi:cyclophilin family peptidyl-prolyl cis-trans isomerase
MINKSHLTIFVLSVLLLGAGCTQPVANDQSSTTGTGSQAETTNTATKTTTDESMNNASEWSYQGKLADEKITNKQIRISTAKGDIVFELLPDVAPITVSNFVYLTEGGYYDGLTFHRREEGFVIQGGDPLGSGIGGPGYTIQDEFNDTKHERGIVAMAKTSAPNSAGSQFYITLAPAYFLDNNYTVFGRVLSGMEIVDQIQVGDIMTKVVVEDLQK